jgi:hypothetical protein
MNPYEGARGWQLTREWSVMQAIETAHAAYVAAIKAARERAQWTETQEQLDDLMNGLADLRSDCIDGPMRSIEEAEQMREMRAEQGAALSARPEVI